MSCDCWPTMPPFRRRLVWVCEHQNKWIVRLVNDVFSDGPIPVWLRKGRHKPPAPR